MGGIDVDPATNDAAQAVVCATVAFTLETDGLAHEWPGRVFLNPPYSDPAPFVAHLLAELDAGRTTEAIVLVNARTSSVWWASLAARAGGRCDVRGRVRFWRPSRPEGSAGRMGSVFFYVGGNVSRFVEVFRSIGTVTATRYGTCDVCGGPLLASRADAAYCSGACRQKAHRRRQAARRRVFESEEPLTGAVDIEGASAGRLRGSDQEGGQCGASSRDHTGGQIQLASVARL
jgi:hypothetical protein